MAKLPSESIQTRDVVPFLDMEQTPPSEKSTAKYCKKISESIYSYYVNNKTELRADDRWVDEIRMIGQGKQSVDFYKRYVSNSYTDSASSIDITTDELLAYEQNTADASRYGWINAIWDNVSPIANVKTTAKSIIKQKDYDIRANVIDIDAMEEEDMRMLKAYAEAKAKPLIDAYRRKWGLPVVENQMLINDFQRLQEIKRRGGFKPHYILGLQQAMRHTEKISEWDNHLKEKFFDDVFDLSTAFAISKYCPTTYKVKWEYLDPKDVIVQYSDRFDFADSDYFAYFNYPTINQVRAFAHKVTDGVKQGLDNEDWKKIGKHYSSYHDNPSIGDWEKAGTDVNWSSKYGESRVCVLNTYWIDYETEKYVEYSVEKYDRTKRRPYKDGEKLKKGDRLFKNRTQKVYYCSWIVGTDFVYDFGVMPNQPRKNLREAILPFAGFKMKEKSYTQRLAPAAHLFAIAWIRFCNAIAKAQNDFYYIDLQSIADISDGNKKFPWDKVIKMMREENILFGDSTKYTPNFGGTGIPIQKVQGTLAEDIMKEMGIMESAYNMIEKLTGLSPVALGATPQKDQAVGTTEMSLASANNALRVIIGGVMVIKKWLGVTGSSMVQNVINEDEDAAKEYARVIGADDVQAIKDARREFMEIGIDLEPRPSEELKRSLLEIAKFSLEKRNQGMAGLDETQLMWLQYHFDTGGDFLEAFFKMQDWIEQDKKRIEQEKMAIQQAQTESNARVAQVAEEERRKSMELKMTIDQNNERAKALTDRANSDADALNELRKMKVEYMKEAGQDPTNELERMIRELSSPVPPEAA